MTFPEALDALPGPLRTHLVDTVLPLCGWDAAAGTGPVPDFTGRRFAFFRRNLRRGGSARVMIEQLAALESTGAASDVYVFEPGWDADVEAEIRSRCPSVRRIRRVSRRLASWRTLWLEELGRRHDLSISTDIQDPMIFAATVRTFGVLRPPRIAAVLHEEYDRYLAFLNPHADRIAAYALDYDFRGRFRAVFGDAAPAGIVAPLFPLRPGLAAGGPALRQALDIPAEAAVLAYAGRLDRNKRIERLADLLEDVLAAGREAWLLLAGRWEDEAYAAEVRSRFDREVVLPGGARGRLKDRVREAGAVPEMGAVYHAADIFVFASAVEGFYPLVVMEAQQAGLPVVCTGAGGLGRVILDGVTGRVVPTDPTPAEAAWRPDSRAAFARAVLGLLDDPAARRRLGEAGALAVQALTEDYPFAGVFLKWVQMALAAGGAA